MKMEEQYLDEKIIKISNYNENKNEEATSESNQANNIADGIKIQGRIYTFEKTALYDNKFTILLPTNFKRMDEAVAKFKYPSEERPEIILSDDTGATNITFNYIPEEITNEEIPNTRDAMVKILKKLHPSSRWFEIGEKNVKEKNVAFCEFSSPALDGNIFNVMYFVEIHENILMGTINFKANEKKYWKIAAHQIIETIEEIPKEEK